MACQIPDSDPVLHFQTSNKCRRPLKSLVDHHSWCVGLQVVQVDSDAMIQMLAFLVCIFKTNIKPQIIHKQRKVLSFGLSTSMIELFFVPPWWIFARTLGTA